MEDKKLLIVGIDPGITTAYAILDIDGRFIFCDSSKQLDINLLISSSIKFGKVILVGTDKAKTPSLVLAFASKLGARIVAPKEDLKVDEKKQMISNFNFEDEHQGDALASALFAYRQTRNLLEKIDQFAKENKKQQIKDKIKELVISKKVSIRDSVNIIEKKDEESAIVEKVIYEKRLSEDDFLRLHTKLKKYESELKLIKMQNNSLKNRLAQLENTQAKADKAKNEDKLIDFREKRIKFLESVINSKGRNFEELKNLIKKYNGVLSDIDGHHILKKLSTFGLNEFNFKNPVLGIKRNDILLVEDPNIFSSSVIDFLKDKIFVVIHKKPISKKIEQNLPFVFISQKNLEINEDRYFAFVNRKQFEKEKSRVNWISKILADFRRERELSS